MDHSRSRHLTEARSTATRALSLLAGLALTLVLPLAANAQTQAESRANKANWQLAEKYSAAAINQVMGSTSLGAGGWVRETDSLWYPWRDNNGTTFYLVQTKTKDKKPLFDHQKLAAQLTLEHKKPVDPKNLPFTAVTWMTDLKTIRFTVDSLRYEYSLPTETLKGVGLACNDSTATAGAAGRGGGGGGRGGGGGGGGGQGRGGGGGGGADFRNYSPDSTHFAFAKDHNLYVVIVATRDTIQLTRVGVAGYSFGFRDTTVTATQDTAAADMDPEMKMLADINDFYNNSDLPGDYERFLSRLTPEQQQQQQQQQQQGGRGGAQVQANGCIVQGGRGAAGQDQGRQGGGAGNQGRGGRGATPNRDPRVRANVVWSTDSKTFYIQRNDGRGIDSLYLVQVLNVPRPEVVPYAYAMPGETKVSQQELWGWRVGDKEARKLPVSKWKDQRISSMHYGSTSERIRMWRRDRLQRNAELIEVDLSKGNSVRVMVAENFVDANIEPATLQVKYLNGTTRDGDFVLWSERTGWAHWYLYDNSGKLKNAITSGPWRADGAAVVFDSVKRVLFLPGVGREPGENPYYRHLYRVNMDGTGFTLMDPGNANHTGGAASLSNSRKFFIDVSTRMDMAPKITLRDAMGAHYMDLEETDLTRLKGIGWKAPTPFQVKSADGVTDIYGNMYVPFDLDTTKKYPIILSIYPGPQTEQVTYAFSTGAAPQRLAQLGFVVIQIGNRGGSPQRSNAYQSYSYYNLRDYGLADKKAGVEQLALRYKFIDIERVGMYGHSGGGFMTAAALLVPPYNDFFDVGVSSSGNHDNNVYNQNWSEQYHGLREIVTPKSAIVAASDSNDQNAGRGGPNRAGAGGGGGTRGGGGGGGRTGAAGAATGGAAAGRAARPAGSFVGTGTPLSDSVDITFEIHVPTNAEVAGNLKGRLLLVHGDMDNNVHPAGTIRLADALIRANKRFDLFIMPGAAHGYGQGQTYFNRMLYEYFSEHLLGDNYRGSAEIRPF